MVLRGRGVFLEHLQVTLALAVPVAGARRVHNHQAPFASTRIRTRRRRRPSPVRPEPRTSVAAEPLLGARASLLGARASPCGACAEQGPLLVVISPPRSRPLLRRAR